MAIVSSLNLTGISSGLKSLKTGLGRVQNSTNNLKNVVLNRTRFKKEAISGRINLNNRREENIRRKEQEDILESTGIKGIARRTGSIIASSTKGFLGRLLDFVSTLLVGWLIYNLPTILAAIRNLIFRIQKLFGILQRFMNDTIQIFYDFGNILSGVLYNVTHLDFFDSQKKVQNALNDFESTFNDMGKQFQDGMDLFTTPLGELPGEEPIPSTGTDYTTPGGGGKMVGGSNKEKTMSFLISSGLTQAQAAGIAGNIQQESHFDPKADNGSHHGIAQWDKQDRWPRVSNYIRSIGKDPNTLEGQLHGLVWEAKTYGTWQRVSKAGSVSQASDIFLKEFEKPGNYGVEAPRRSAFGQQIYSQYKGYNPQEEELKKSVSGKGGKVIEYITGDRSSPRYSADHGGKNYHDHLAFDSQETRDAAMRFLTGKGWTIGSVNTGKHVQGSLHYKNLAFDIPFYPNQSKKGVSDDAKGETSLSSRLRADLIAGGFGGPQLGGGSFVAQPQIEASSLKEQRPSIVPERRGQEIVVVDDRQPQQSSNSQVGYVSEQILPTYQTNVNSLIKRQMLLELAYT